MRALSAAFVLLVACPALAAPITLSHAGYLLTGEDQPIGATTPMVFRIYADPTSTLPGDRVWESASCAVPVAQGYYAVELGAGCNGTPALDDAHLPGAARWLEIVVGGVTLSPRLAVASAPSAVRALDANTLAGLGPSAFAPATHLHVAADVGDFDAAAVAAITGAGLPLSSVTGITSTTAWAGTIPATRVTGVDLANLVSRVGALEAASANGSVATVGASAPVACAPGTTGRLHFDTTLGVLTVCDGNIYRAASGATLAVPTGLTLAGSGPTTLQATWSSVANAAGYEVGFHAGSTFSAALAVVQAASTGVTFPGLTSGVTYVVAVRSVSGSTRSDWSAGVSALAGRDGSNSAAAAVSCQALRTAFPSKTSGPFWLDPDDGGSQAPFYGYCEMDANGNGWTLVMRGGSTVPTKAGWNTRAALNLAAASTAGHAGQTFKLADAVINALTGVYRIETAGSYANLRYVPAACAYDHTSAAGSSCRTACTNADATGCTVGAATTYGLGIIGGEGAVGHGCGVQLYATSAYPSYMEAGTYNMYWIVQTLGAAATNATCAYGPGQQWQDNANSKANSTFLLWRK